MGLPKFLAGTRFGGFAITVIFILLLGVYLLFGTYWIYGIILLVIGLLGLTTFKFLSGRLYQGAENVEKSSIYPGFLIGLVIFAVIGGVYAFVKGIPLNKYSAESLLYIFLPGIIGALIGGYLQKVINRK